MALFSTFLELGSGDHFVVGYCGWRRWLEMLLSVVQRDIAWDSWWQRRWRANYYATRYIDTRRQIDWRPEILHGLSVMQSYNISHIDLWHSRTGWNRWLRRCECLRWGWLVRSKDRALSIRKGRRRRSAIEWNWVWWVRLRWIQEFRRGFFPSRRVRSWVFRGV